MLRCAVLLGLNALDWYALGQMLVGLAAVGGSIWAVRLYRASRSLEAAKWLDGIFRDFYVNESFTDVRWLLARRTFLSRVAPILDRSIKDPSDILNEGDAQTLHRIDRLLNFFEHILYMESEGHLPVKARDAFFGYWFELMKSDPYLPLRKYLKVYGYEYLARFLSSTPEPSGGSFMRRGTVSSTSDRDVHLSPGGQVPAKASAAARSESAVLEIEVPPAEVERLADPKTGEDEEGE